MPIELSFLSASVALVFVHLAAEAVIANLNYKPSELLGARDNFEMRGHALARAKRATQNMLESMILFAPLVLIAHATHRLNETTQLGAGLFLAGRLVYAPCYWFGVPVVRTLAWTAGIVGIAMIFLQVLPFSGA
ncbi:MAG: MAPEG family protein [Pseudomonadota bacterium]